MTAIADKEKNNRIMFYQRLGLSHICQMPGHRLPESNGKRWKDIDYPGIKLRPARYEQKINMGECATSLNMTLFSIKMG